MYGNVTDSARVHEYIYLDMDDDFVIIVPRPIHPSSSIRPYGIRKRKPVNPASSNRGLVLDKIFASLGRLLLSIRTYPTRKSRLIGEIKRILMNRFYFYFFAPTKFLKLLENWKESIRLLCFSFPCLGRSISTYHEFTEGKREAQLELLSRHSHRIIRLLSFSARHRAPTTASLRPLSRSLPRPPPVFLSLLRGNR